MNEKEARKAWKNYWIRGLVTTLILTLAGGLAMFALEMFYLESYYGKELINHAEKMAYYDEILVEDQHTQASHYAMAYNETARGAAVFFERDPRLLKEDFKARNLGVDEMYHVAKDGTILEQDGERTPEQIREILSNFDENWQFTNETSQRIERLLSDKIMGEEAYFAAGMKDGTGLILVKNVDRINERLSRFTVRSFLRQTAQNNELSTALIADGTEIYTLEQGEVVRREVDQILPEYQERKSGKASWQHMDDKIVYATYASVESDNYPVEVICYISRADMRYSATVNGIVTGALVFFFCAMMFIVSYFKSRDFSEKGEGDQKFLTDYMNRISGNGVRALATLAVLVTVFIAYDMHMFYRYAQQTVYADNVVMTLRKGVQETEDSAERLWETIEEENQNKTGLIAHYLEAVPSLEREDQLSYLADQMDLAYVAVFDTNGDLQLTAGSRSRLDLHNEIGKDAAGNEISFWDYLQKGGEFITSRTERDSITGSVYVSTASTLRYKTGKLVGYLECGIDEGSILEEDVLVSVKQFFRSLDSSMDSDLYIVNMEKGIVEYAPDSELIGVETSDAGLEEDELVGSYYDTLYMRDKKYFAISSEQDGRIAYVCIPESELKSGLWKILLIVFAGAGLIFFGMSANLSRMWTKFSKFANENPEVAQRVMVDTGHGAGKVTLAAFDRGEFIRTKWKEKTGNEKILTASRILAPLVLIGCIILIYLISMSREHTTLDYIMSERWVKSFNVFSLTTVLFIQIMFYLVIILLKWILLFFENILGPRGETICRLLKNILTYIGALILVGVIAYQFGADMTSILASAGIGALIVGLGAKDLITDLIAGVFAIFDGTFQVGDVIQVGNVTGVVRDIGIRVTKIVD